MNFFLKEICDKNFLNPYLNSFCVVIYAQYGYLDKAGVNQNISGELN